MGFSVRPFRPAEMDTLLVIERASFGRDAYDRKLFAEYAQICGSLFLVLEGIPAPAPKLAAYSIACICRSRPGLANLISIAVHPDARGRGAASLLLQSTVRRLKLRGINRLTLMVRKSNAPAIHFYERHKFKFVRRLPNYYGREDGLLMRRAL
jgi:ribosomal-protein-alanine N-acetyltransferase